MRVLACCLALLAGAQRAGADPDDVPAAGSRYFLGIGLGLASGRDSDAVELVKSLPFGVPYGKSQQIVASVEFAEARVDDVPTYRDHDAVLVGLRTTPWPANRERTPRHTPSRYVDFTALHVTLLVGRETCSTTTYEMAERHVTSTSAPVFGFGAGYTPFQGADWAFGVEVTGRLAHYDDHNEVAYGYVLVAYLMK